jgi:hypothetical protein
MFFKLANVFKKFSFSNLLDESMTCACTTTSRLLRFCDPLTQAETSSFCKLSLHVQSMDLNILQYKALHQALAQGLNHIPLKPTCIVQAVAIIMSAFEQLNNILNLEVLSFPLTDARNYFHSVSLTLLKSSMKTNRYGFRFSGIFLLDIPLVKNEIDWLT